MRTYPDVGGRGQPERAETFVLGAGRQDGLVKKLFQVGHHHVDVEGVVHTAAVDGQLQQTVDEVPANLLTCSVEGGWYRYMYQHN